MQSEKSRVCWRGAHGACFGMYGMCQCAQVNRYYYYRAEKPEVRTWYKPLPDQEEEEEVWANQPDQT